MLYKTTAIFLGIFLAIQPLSHATQPEDELLKKLANQAVTEACVKAAEGSASLQKAILETAQENVKWLAVVESMSLPLRAHLAGSIVTDNGMDAFKEYLIRSTDSPDHHSKNDMGTLLSSVDLQLFTRKTSDDRVNYERNQWQKELKKHFGLVEDQPGTLSLARRQFQYAEAAVKIAATAFVTLPKAERLWLEKKIRARNPSKWSGPLFFGLLGGFTGAMAHVFADMHLLLIIPSAILSGIAGGHVLGNAWVRSVIDPLLSTSHVTTVSPLVAQPPEGLLLKDVYFDGTLPNQVASGSVSLVDAVQLGAWELVVLQAEVKEALNALKAKGDSSAASIWNLALRVELLRREIEMIRKPLSEIADQEPESSQANIIAEALALRHDHAQQLISRLLEAEAYRQSQSGSRATAEAKAAGDDTGTRAKKSIQQSVDHLYSKLKGVGEQEMKLRAKAAQ